MASNSLLICFVVAAFLAPSVFATEFIVGDAIGWTTKFDYAAWAEGKTFYVGDTLVFNYIAGMHNVHKVNQTGFEQCLIPSSGALETGKDVITLATPGKKWYICGKGKHCEVGKQKLAITVESAAPAPAPSASAKMAIVGFGFVAALLMNYLV
ncbi:unnamed protein product [Rhodiola kirilowii]